MKRLILVLLALATSAGATGMDTYYEKSGYKETPRYAETVEFCEQLAEASSWLHYTNFGNSPQGRELPLVIADRDGHFYPQQKPREGKVVLLVQAGIHSGEIDGKDAGLMLLRDIAVTREYQHLLDHITLLFIPIFNVDGHERFGPHSRINQNGPVEMGWRTTSQNLNLNRDYLKADAPEMRAWIALYNAWQPDFFVDCHVTDGADYQYVLTYLLDIFGNMSPGLSEWTRDVYLTGVEEAMTKAGVEIFPYVYLVDWPNPKAGIKSWVSTPRFSNGYTSIRNRPGLLIETHMLKDYRTRVDATYEMLKQTMVLLNKEYASLTDVVKEADRFTAGREFRDTALFPLQFEHSERAVPIEFKGVDFQVRESDLTGGMWYRFNGKPVTFKTPYYNMQIPTAEADLPEAYIIPPQWQSVIERLELHGIELIRLDKAHTLSVDTYRFHNVSWQSSPFEGRHPLSFELEEISVEKTYPAGSALVNMNQRGARVIAHILEPNGPDSYVYWGFFDAIFEQKEYAESYVMEEMAREMLAADEELKKTFEKKKEQDQEFAQNPRAILNWFFQQTPYWDDRKNVYPIGKIFRRDAMKSLMNSD
ncbi:MAG: M14 family metallopeptidase [Candidatus Krumholzibacteria bacterium]|nr:M14 family metallopeptidase [Candidatus Krumholzibacteria bacterium]